MIRFLMRVLAVGNMYPPHHLGGYEVICQGLVNHLNGSGHAVRVLTTDYVRPDRTDRGIEDPDVHRELEWYWQDHHWRSMTPIQRLALEHRNAARFDHHLGAFRPDVIMWWALGGMSLSLVERARRAGVPAVFFVLDYWPDYARKRDLWTSMWRRAPRVLRRLAEWCSQIPIDIDLDDAGRWLFCSRTMESETVKLGLDPADRMILSPGVDDSFFGRESAGEAVPWRWRLLYVGRVVETKGVRTAIEALPSLPRANLRIVGDGDDRYKSMLRELAERLHVDDRVKIEQARARDRLVDLYRAADVVVFPVQWSEPWGLVPLEAMAAGRPVIATGTGGSGDYLRDGLNCLLFEAGDSVGLADAVRRLAADPDLRMQLKRGGDRTARAHSERTFNENATEQLSACAARTRAPRVRRRRGNEQRRSPF